MFILESDFDTQIRENQDIKAFAECLDIVMPLDRT